MLAKFGKTMSGVETAKNTLGGYDNYTEENAEPESAVRCGLNATYV